MNNKLISGIITAVIMAVIVAILLAFGYDPPDPPIPEEGVEVNLGNSDFGLGDDARPAAAAAASSAASPNQVATQRVDPTPNIGASENQGNAVKPAAEPTANQSREPEINRNALFPGKRNQQSGSGSQGISSGTGDQGKPNGSPNSNNYIGNGGGNGNYNLAGRSSVTLPRPDYSSNEQGTVVITIWVDREGKVTRAEYQPKGSNTSNGYLVNQARNAALRARFNPDPAAPDEQRGTITYIFKI